MRPLNLGQASRISGVSPADMGALMIYMEKRGSKMNVIELTHTIQDDMPVYPGTEQPVLTTACTIRDAGYRETILHMYSADGYSGGGREERSSANRPAPTSPPASPRRCCGAATCWGGPSPKDMAVLEVDERASVRIFPYVKPDYAVVTNLTRTPSCATHTPATIADILTRVSRRRRPDP